MPSNWSKVNLNDSREIQLLNISRRRSRQSYVKLVNSPTPKKTAVKLGFYQRYLAKPKRMSGLIVSPKKSVRNGNVEWHKEYDIWNMIMQALEQQKSANQSNQMDEIGIRDSNNVIRFVRNREELKQQFLVGSNGMKSQVSNLIDANDSRSKVSLKVQIKMVPVVECFELINGSEKTSYQLGMDTNDPNNNVEEVVNKNVKRKPSHDRTLTNDVNDISNATVLTHCDMTITNPAGMLADNIELPSVEYYEFMNEARARASSIIILDEKENIPIRETPKRDKTFKSRTFFDSPMPVFAKQRTSATPRVFAAKRLFSVMNACKNAKILSQLMTSVLSRIENTCMDLMSTGYRSGINGLMSDDFTISGCNLLSDSVEL